MVWPFKKKVVEKAPPVKVSLSTHIVYPQINAEVDGSWVARLHLRSGKAVETMEGKADNRAAAIEEAVDAIQAIHENYLKGKG